MKNNLTVQIKQSNLAQCFFFSCSGECLVYGFDDLTGALQLSHRLILSSKDYPGIL